jgi:hypothetical protein
MPNRLFNIFTRVTVIDTVFSRSFNKGPGPWYAQISRSIYIYVDSEYYGQIHDRDVYKWTASTMEQQERGYV